MTRIRGVGRWKKTTKLIKQRTGHSSTARGGYNDITPPWTDQRINGGLKPENG